MLGRLWSNSNYICLELFRLKLRRCQWTAKFTVLSGFDPWRRKILYLQWSNFTLVALSHAWCQNWGHWTHNSVREQVSLRRNRAHVCGDARGHFFHRSSLVQVYWLFDYDRIQAVLSIEMPVPWLPIIWLNTLWDSGKICRLRNNNSVSRLVMLDSLCRLHHFLRRGFTECLKRDRRRHLGRQSVERIRHRLVDKLERKSVIPRLFGLLILSHGVERRCTHQPGATHEIVLGPTHCPIECSLAGSLLAEYSFLVRDFDGNFVWARVDQRPHIDILVVMRLIYQESLSSLFDAYICLGRQPLEGQPLAPPVARLAGELRR